MQLIIIFALFLATLYHVEAKNKYMQRPTHKGMGTAYSGAYEIDKTGKNACQFNAKKLPKKWQLYYAAMNKLIGRKWVVKKECAADV